MTDPADPNRPEVGQITLRYWAAARSAAGVPEEVVEATGPISLAELVAGARGRHGESLGAVLEVCGVLVGDRPVGRGERARVDVVPGETVEFLPPFAGG